MPEAPEVHYIASVLNTKLRGQKLIGIYVHGVFATEERHKLLATKVGKLNRVAHEFDVMFGSVFCKGKILFISLVIRVDPKVQLCLANHMKLKGYWNADPTNALLEIRYGIENKLYYHDPIHLSNMLLLGKAEMQTVLGEIGPDILYADFTVEVLRAVLDSGATVGTRLVDQAVISGIGNYLRSEVLWKAKISPWRPCNSLTSGEIERLFTAIKFICEQHNKELSDHFQGELVTENEIMHYSENRMNVYKRKFDPDGKVVTVKKLGGRPIYFVESRQK